MGDYCKICEGSGWTETGPCRECDGSMVRVDPCSECARLRADLAEASVDKTFWSVIPNGWALRIQGAVEKAHGLRVSTDLIGQAGYDRTRIDRGA